MPNGTEPQPMEFDVGRVVRDTQGKFLGTSPNLAMPSVLALLLVELDALTNQIETRNAERGETDALNTDVLRWRARLNAYKAANAAAPLADRKAILWTVTAPLLLGFHGGPTGTEIPLTPGGYPAGFSTTAEHGADVGTPYSLANQMGVSEAWDKRRLELLLEDLESEARKGGGYLETYARSYWPIIVGGVAATGVVGYLAYRAGKKTGGVEVKVSNGRRLNAGR